jgi:hypothetical protein
LRQVARAAGIDFAVCCLPEVRDALGCAPAGCNQWDWACRVYPELATRPRLPNRPTRKGCACSQEVDIGVYDTCTLGCRYSYGSRDQTSAQRAFERHDPTAPCLRPE